MTNTLASAIEETGFDVHPYLDRDSLIPVLDGLQAQGDLLFLPVKMVAALVRVNRDATWLRVPRQGVELLRGTAAGNAHTLLSGRWTTDVTDQVGLAIGVMELEHAAYVAHVEHGYLGIAPGTYVVRRQREQADVIALVAD
jgi:hypothetical protein